MYIQPTINKKENKTLKNIAKYLSHNRNFFFKITNTKQNSNKLKITIKGIKNLRGKISAYIKKKSKRSEKKQKAIENIKQTKRNFLLFFIDFLFFLFLDINISLSLNDLFNRCFLINRLYHNICITIINIYFCSIFVFIDGFSRSTTLFPSNWDSITICYIISLTCTNIV